jgi:hypothetical protein
MSSQKKLGFYNGEKYHHSLGLENAVRTTAFAQIYSKSKASVTKSKTQMCRSISRGFVCKFGDKCSYAHSETELVKQECAFGDSCRTKNSKTRPCQYAHTKNFTPAPAAKPDLAKETKVKEDEMEVLRKEEKRIRREKRRQENLANRASMVISLDDDSDDETEEPATLIDPILSVPAKDPIVDPEEEEMARYFNRQTDSMNDLQPEGQLQENQPGLDFQLETSQVNQSQDMQQSISDHQHMIILDQQKHINMLNHQLHTPCIPIVISPFQYSILFGRDC